MQTEELLLSKNGRWLSRKDGEDWDEVTHAGTIALFFKALRRDPTGYFLEVGNERKSVEVEDTPQFVTRIEGSAANGFSVEFSDGLHESLDPRRLRYAGEGRLTLLRAQDGIEARFLHAPYYELLKGAQERDGNFGLEIQGSWIALGPNTRP